MNDYKIRPIEKGDDRVVESVIRSCLIEYGADHEGTAWADPDLCRFSEIYCTEGNRYWVAVDGDGNVVGGAGIGYLTEDICELQKMYLLPALRGSGAASALLAEALSYAARYYKRCYLETLPNMVRAQRFYEKNGFTRVYESVVTTSHFACDVRYILEL